MSVPEWIKTDSYFLSRHNPVATADQVWVEKTALRLWERDDIQQAIKQARFLWVTVSERASHAAKTRLDDFIPEYAMNYVIKAVASDANHPRVGHNWMMAHEWFGHKMRGARMGGDNQDNVYHMVGIEHGGAYRIDGSRLNQGPADTTWTIVANSGTSMTLASLDNEDLVVKEDGNFTVTIDDQPANGRPNHLQTQRGALFLFVRDSIGDWASERANTIRVKRLNPSPEPPLSDDEMAFRAIDWMLRDVPLYFWFTYLSHGKEYNRVTGPHPSGAVGGLRSQYGGYATVSLADDEAFVVTLNSGNAAFRDVFVHDWWHLSIEPDQRTSSFNNSQMAPDDDGNFTFVISPEDPGIHNWLDTGGLREVIFILRFQGVPRATPEGQLPRLISEKIVKRDQLDLEAQGAKRITPDERVSQLRARKKSYDLRHMV